MESTNPSCPQDVTKDYNTADFVGNTRIVFDIASNKYRLVEAFRYDKQICWIKFIGTHAQYDKIDVISIEHR